MKRFFKLWPFHNLNVGGLDALWYLSADQYVRYWKRMIIVSKDLASFNNKSIDDAIRTIANCLRAPAARPKG